MAHQHFRNIAQFILAVATLKSPLNTPGPFSGCRWQTSH